MPMAQPHAVEGLEQEIQAAHRFVFRLGAYFIEPKRFFNVLCMPEDFKDHLAPKEIHLRPPRCHERLSAKCVYPCPGLGLRGGDQTHLDHRSQTPQHLPPLKRNIASFKLQRSGLWDCTNQFCNQIDHLEVPFMAITPAIVCVSRLPASEGHRNRPCALGQRPARVSATCATDSSNHSVDERRGNICMIL